MGQQIFDSSEFEDTINIVYIYIFFLIYHLCMRISYIAEVCQ